MGTTSFYVTPIDFFGYEKYSTYFWKKSDKRTDLFPDRPHQRIDPIADILHFGDLQILNRIDQHRLGPFSCFCRRKRCAFTDSHYFSISNGAAVLLISCDFKLHDPIRSINQDRKNIIIFFTLDYRVPLFICFFSIKENHHSFHNRSPLYIFFLRDIMFSNHLI